MLEDFLESLLKPVNVVVNQVLLGVLALVDQTHQREALVNLAQVEHDVVLLVGRVQFDDATRLLVKLRAALLFHAVDAGYVNHHLDQLAADLVLLHVHGVAVRCDVDFADYVEQESLLDLAPGD